MNLRIKLEPYKHESTCRHKIYRDIMGSAYTQVAVAPVTETAFTKFTGVPLPNITKTAKLNAKLTNLLIMLVIAIAFIKVC